MVRRTAVGLIVLAAALFLGALGVRSRIGGRASRPAERREAATPGAPERAPSLAPPLRASAKPSPSVRPSARSLLERFLAALRKGDLEEIARARKALLEALRPERVAEEENAAPLYRLAFEKLVDASEEEEEAFLALLSEDPPPTAEQRELARNYLEKNREALELARRAAARPRCNFEVDYSAGIAAELPHLAKLIRLSKLLAAEAALQEGARAPEAALVARRVADAVAEEPLLVSQLVRGVCHGFATATWEEALEGAADAAAIAGMMGDLAPERFREGFERSLMGELAMATQVLEPGFDPKSVGLEGFRLPQDPLTQHDFVHLADTLAEAIDLVGRPFYEVRERLEVLQRTRIEGAPWYAEYSRLLLPAVLRAAQREAEFEAGAGAARIGAGLRLYALRHGSYPATLQAAAPYLPGPLFDPCSGKPYVYRREGGGFVLYSVGADGIDQGGVSEEEDVVFRIRR